MDETRIAWLAGLIDGEGCIQARMLARDNALLVELRIEAVSERMIAAVCQILDGIEVEYRCKTNVCRPRFTRPAVRLVVHRKDHVRRLLLAVLSHLIVKRPEAERCLQFLEKSCLVSCYRMDHSDRSLCDDLKALKRIA